jgi:hypothetical protein
VFTNRARVELAGRFLFDQDAEKMQTPYRAFVAPLQRGVYPLSVDFLHAEKSSGFDFVLFQVQDGETEWWKHKLFEVKNGARP